MTVAVEAQVQMAQPAASSLPFKAHERAARQVLQSGSLMVCCGLFILFGLLVRHCWSSTENMKYVPLFIWGSYYINLWRT